MKKFLLGVSLMLCAVFGFSQGLEDIIVETYYVSDADDAADSDGGSLPLGSVTYRVYVDMLPGYSLQAVYGDANHELRFETTTLFFNNEDRGETTGEQIGDNRLDDNTVALDSWLSMGGASDAHLGILKTDDPDGSFVGGANSDGGSEGVDLLKNNDPAAGLPLTTADGLVPGIPEAVTVVGLDLTVFADANDGPVFSSNNGSWASLNGAQGPDAANRVLVAQITTDGDFSFSLNVQMRSPGGVVEQYVASNPIGSETQFAGLTFTTAATPGCTSATACNFDANATEDDGSCVEPTAGCTECQGGALVTIDADGDGVCDADEVAGCTSASACNFDALATDEDGSCIEPIAGCQECNATNDGLVIVDIDNDGICDSEDDEIIGLEDVIVEVYYVSDADDAADTDGGSLPEGAVTYRVYMDMLPGFALQAVYGDANHELLLETTTLFFNNEDRGETTGEQIGDNRLDDNTVALDSWLSMGGASDEHLGILKTDDPDGSFIGGANSDGGSEGVDLLKNNDPAAGIPLTTADGLVPGIPEAVTVVGLDLSVFADVNDGPTFSSNNGSWASLNGAMGPDANNRVLVAQITTDGDFLFELNVQMRSPQGEVQQYVARNAQGTEVEDARLIFNSNPDVPGCTSPTACNFDAAATTDDGSCIEPVANCSECQGGALVIVDTDGDGICDADEIAGCTDAAACNFDAAATDDNGTCLIPTPGCTECNGAALALIDADGDGVCDADEVAGCTSASACNFDALATDDNGSCIEPIAGCQECNATNDGLVIVDIDNDGICDSEDDEIIGLEDVIVEVYYVSDADDAADTDGGSLPEGAVTYRVYMDMLPGFALQAVYGDANHELLLETTTLFFNNEDRGETTGEQIGDNRLDDNTVALDSWLSMGGASDEHLGILKTDDPDGSFIGGANSDGGSEGVDLLKNNDPAAGIPLTTADGLVPGIPEAVTVVGLDLSVFADVNDGPTFSSNNGSWASLNGAMGPDANNRVLVAQITTDGDFLFELNVQMRSPQGEVQQYVARNAQGTEVEDARLIFNSNPDVPGCTSPTACNFDAAATTDDGSCIEPVANCSECQGGALVIVDTDGDGICDADEIAGCTDAAACNFDAAATDDNGTCLIPTPGCTECNGAALALIDADGDGVCDADEVAGCTSASACNFDALATDDNGSCIEPIAGCQECNATNDGLVIVDIDNDGICDSEDDEIIGLEDVIVEVYYVSDADDAADTDGGSLPEGAVTYRVYMDMLPGFALQAVYGDANHDLTIETSTLFFNNEDRGETTGEQIGDNRLDDNTVALDSWLSMGGASGAHLGILKTDDPDGSFIGGANSDGGSEGVDLLKNNDPAAGIPLTTADGLVPGIPEAVTVVGLDLSVFADVNDGPLFTSNNGSWASLNGAMGPDANNRVLVAQITTDGDFSFEMNVQMRSPQGEVQQFVAQNAQGTEIEDARLIFDSNPDVPGCTSPTACNFDAAATTDDGSCIEPVANCSECQGGALVIVDTDGDGICDADEIAGCTDAAACNFDAAATDDNGTCLIPTPGCTECNGAALALIDADGDGVCDADEVAGCTSASACNFDALATDEDGSCIEPIANCQECNATNDGLVIVDIDGDGICDADDDEIIGLEDVIVEVYYVSDADDAADTDGGSLPEGAVTYRVYMDMLPGFALQAVYGDANHDLTIETSTLFFNNEDRGETTGEQIGDNRLDDNTVALDSWLSMGGASGAHLGILKTDDPDGSFIGGANSDGGSEGVDLLKNNDPAAGIPLTTADGLVPGIPEAVTVVGLDLSVFADVNDGPLFTSNNGSWASLNGAMGPDANNRVLVAQITTDGDFSFEMNVQMRSPQGEVQQFVAQNAQGTEIEDARLIFDSNPDVPGCTSPTACNFDAAATTDDGSCIEPVANCSECQGGALVIVDTDGDGICDADEIAGCTDAAACNFDAAATDDNGTCLIPTPGCTECNGAALALIDADGDGVCDADEVAGCTSASACNFDALATDEDGSCIEPIANCQECNATNDGLVIVDIDGDGICDADDDEIIGLEDVIVEVYYVSDADDAADTDGGSLPEGAVTYRVYMDMLPGFALQAVYGDANHDLTIETSTLFFNNEDRGETTGEQIGDNRLDDNTVALDSWLSMGGASGAHLGILKTDDPDGSFIGGANSDGGSEGVDLLKNNDPAAGIPLTTADGLVPGIPEAVTVVGLDLSVFADVNDGPLFTSNNGSWASLNGAMGPDANNRVLVAQITTDGDFSFEMNVQMRSPQGEVQQFVAQNAQGTEIEDARLIFDTNPDVPGCTSPTACNFDAAANVDDGSCIEPVANCSECQGGALVIVDTDGDGICDADEIAGCTSATACNFDATATDEDGSCIEPTPFCTECDGALLVLIDADGDGICDADEIAGCTSATACNFDATATDDDGSCIEPTANCTECDGAVLVLIDADGDGICDADEIAGCTSATACNFDATATDDDGSCIEPTAGCTECDGAVLVLIDADGDGICDADEIAGCTSATACNFDATATDEDGSCIEPTANCTECDGAVLVLIDADGDGICDADEIAGCTSATACNFDALATDDDGSCIEPTANCTECQGGVLVLIDADGDGICDADEIAGCTSATACNFDATATDDDGSCIEPTANCTECQGGVLVLIDADGDGICDADEIAGCTSATACNFDATATDDDGSCIEPTANCTECQGGVLVLIDADGDGICDADEIAGCTSATACNFDATATDDDGSCIEPTANCTECQGGVLVLIDADGDGICDADEIAGCTSATACNFDATATDDDGSCIEPIANCTECNAANDGLNIIDTDGDGVCDADEIAGCTSNTACNFDVNATDDDGSCLEPTPFCFECDGEVLVIVDSDGDGVCDLDEEGGCTDATACNFDPAATDDNGTCLFPTPGCTECDGAALVLIDSDNDGICDADEIAGCTSATACNFDATATDDDGSCIEPTAGCTECDGAVLVLIDADGDGICDADEIAGCTSATACNFDATATDDDGSCIEPTAGCTECDGAVLVLIDADGDGICDADEIAGCTSATACNFDATATDDDGSCIEPTAGCTECDGAVLVLIDADGDGICDADEIAGCTSATACNFDATATDEDGSCIEPTAGCTECDGAVLVLIDADGDGICDADEIAGCTSATACNFDATATDDDGSCIEPTAGCTECDGAVLVLIDADGDGICDADEIAGCTSATACNFDATATDDDGSCIEPTAGCTECDGAVLVLIDADGDGICDADEIAGCTSATACNFDATATDDDGSCIEPTPFCTECQGGVLVIIDSDNDGICDADEEGGCTSATACNFDPTATDDNGTCIEPTAGCTECDGAVLVLIDADGDGICDADEIAGCTSATACNFDATATDDDGSCIEPTAGCTECDGAVLVLIDADGDGICDADEIAGCTSATACNFDATATDDDGSCIEPTAGCTECDGAVLVLIDADGDGICDADEIAGCTSATACNFDATATDDDGSCIEPTAGCTECDGAVLVLIDADGDGICDADEIAGCTSATACNFDATATDDDGSCIEPTAGCTECDGAVLVLIDADGDGICDADEIAGCTSATACNFDATATDDDGSCIEPTPFCTECQGGVLVIIDSDNDGICDADEEGGCTSATACNFDPTATDDNGTCIEPTAGCTECDGAVLVLIDADGDGICDADEIAGCTSATACNFDATATDEDGSCIEPTAGCTECDGAVLVLIDADGDGICDADEIAGCTSATACNFDATATDDDGSCIEPTSGCTECDGAVLVLIDADGDGICDADEIAGCTSATACNFDATATDDDGSCIEPTAGCTECDGAVLVLIDADGDGICDADEIAGCTSATACNFDAIATDDDGSCIEPTAGCTECDGAVLVLIDADGDGICDADEIAGCTSATACNFDATATDEDGSCIEPTAGCTECDGAVLVLIDADGDGICDADEIAGCTSATACNFDATATDDDGSCIEPTANCTECAGDMLVTIDSDGDGVCDADEILGCTDPAANNYNPQATEDDGSCNFDDACNGLFLNQVAFNLCFGSEARIYFQGPVQLSQYSWIVNGVPAGNSNRVIVPLTYEGDYEVTLIATSSDGACTLTSTETYSVVGPQDIIGEDTIMFSQDDVAYSIDLPAGTEVQWGANSQLDNNGLTPDGLSATIDFGPFWVDGSTIQVFYFDEHGCFQRSMLPIYVEEQIAGCTSPTACNFDATANMDDGSCLEPSAGCAECDGETLVLIDADGDGVCDLDEVLGCTDADAINYDPNATEDDGSCMMVDPCEGLSNGIVAFNTCFGTSARLYPTGSWQLNQYEWYVDGVFFTTERRLVLPLTEAKTYEVELVSSTADGSCTLTAIYDLVVEGPAPINGPTVITPSQDDVMYSISPAGGQTVTWAAWGQLDNQGIVANGNMATVDFGPGWVSGSLLIATYTDDAGCFQRAELPVSVDAAGKVATGALATEIAVYPNPFSGVVNIDMTVGDVEGATLQVVDVRGDVILEEAYDGSASIELGSEYAQGVYFLKVITNNGTIVEPITKQD